MSSRIDTGRYISQEVRNDEVIIRQSAIPVSLQKNIRECRMFPE